MIINSLSNPLIKEAVKLQKSGFRKERGIVVIDGVREILSAQAAGWEFIRVFYCPSLKIESDKISAPILNGNPGKIREISAEAFRKICYKEKPDGFLALVKERTDSWRDVKLGHNPLIVVLERVEKPGNLGAILRSAYAAGVNAIIINDNQTDIYNPNVIRASEGTIFSQPLISAGREETEDWLKHNKIKIYGAATGGAKIYTKTDLSGPLAIVLGSEADGLSPAWLKAVDALIKIPMQNEIDSLNVSVAAAVLIFEALRQRS